MCIRDRPQRVPASSRRPWLAPRARSPGPQRHVSSPGLYHFSCPMTTNLARNSPGSTVRMELVEIERSVAIRLIVDGRGDDTIHVLSLIHISEPTRLGMISYAVFCLK